jgi:DNA repair exonuclease SbcCD ATPase subunit
MIKFQKLRWKNFLSTGNYFNEIDFLENPTNLVVGENGAGKSTMLDALSFALFGKAHRKIKKDQLINTINTKDCRCEVEFTVNSIQYKVVRGIKPAKFEIWKDGTLINQSAHAREYQEILEKNILQMSHKSFHQIVVLGSSSFIPFMQLNSTSRRDVIEDLLDINIFSKMNVILKEKISLLKGELENNNHSIEMVKTRISSQKKYIRDLSAINTAHRKEKESEIESLNADIATFNEVNAELSESVNNLLPSVTEELSKMRTNKTKLEKYRTKFDTQVKSVVKEAKFFEQNEHCPTCDQDIGDELRQTKRTDATDRARELKELMDKADAQLADYQSQIDKLESDMADLLHKQNLMNNNIQLISRLTQNVQKLQDDLAEMADSSGDMAQANKDLNNLDDELHELNDTKYTLVERSSYNRVASELLRDTGIKTKIIKQYIPVINELTNKYLQTLDFFVHFELDESFNETIRSRYRDTFSYDSFSEGEKQRIDLSLLFTWRHIAKMKNSVSTNLLILDETFDSSLDGEGVDNLMKIIDTLKEDTNVFVISHKTELEDAHFERKLSFIKDKNFSRMRDIT